MSSGDAKTQALRTLRDVDGVLGSFVVSADGNVELKDCPSILDDESLSEAGTRLVHLREALDLNHDPLECAVFDYSDYRLLIRPLGERLLVVLAQQSVNVPALKMGATLSVRRLERLSKSAEPQVPAPSEEGERQSGPSRESLPPDWIPIPLEPSSSGPVKRPMPPGMSTERASGTRFYRGTRID